MSRYHQGICHDVDETVMKKAVRGFCNTVFFLHKTAHEPVMSGRRREKKSHHCISLKPLFKEEKKMCVCVCII